MKRFLLLVAFAVLFLSDSSSAQSVATPAVGFTTNTALAGSDTHISVPFIRPPAFVGGIQSASGNNITVSGNPFTLNQFVYVAGSQPNRYYALVGPAGVANPKEGHTYPIVSNTTNTLTVDLGADTLTGIPANAQVLVVPNWTLKTVFPASDANVSFTPTTSVPTYKTQIRVPDTNAAGINVPFANYYFSGGAWKLEGDDVTDRGDDPLFPDSYFVVRNLNGAPTLPLVTLGTVVSQKVTVALATRTTGQQDNPVSLLRPLDVALNATGLNRADGSFVAGDQLLLFNNAQTGYDKTPSIYVVDGAVPNGPWRLVSDPSLADRGSDIIPSGTGFVIRKATGSGQPAFWTNNFPVQAVKAVSRKTHGASGTFDLDLPLSGTPAVEGRRQADGNHKIVFTFPAAVTVSGAMVTSGAATSSAPVVTAGGTEVTVDVTGVSNQQRITVTLLGVNDGSNTNDVAVRMGILTGDANGNGSVTASDVGQVKSQSGQTVTAANFRSDLNVSGGTIGASDIGQAKASSGTSLPPNPTVAPDASDEKIAARE